MANGAEALPATVESSAGERIEAEIAAATFDAASALGRGVLARANGGLDSATRQAGGDRIARLYELQEQTLGKLDFDAVVRQAGGAALRQAVGECIDGNAAAPHDAAAIEQALDGFASEKQSRGLNGPFFFTNASFAVYARIHTAGNKQPCEEFSMSSA